MSAALQSESLLWKLLAAKTTPAVDNILGVLPIVSETEYTWTESKPEDGWRAGWLHWIPVGRDRGNAGRVQLAGDPYNPIAERLVNGMEALIELARRLETLRD